jgi:hypothetical protein
MKVNQFPDRIIEVKRKVIYGGTAYLGMPANPEFQELIIKTYCVGAPLTEVPEMHNIYGI